MINIFVKSVQKQAQDQHIICFFSYITRWCGNFLSISFCFKCRWTTRTLMKV